MKCDLIVVKIDLFFVLMPTRDTIMRGRADTLAGEIRSHTHPLELNGKIGCASCHRRYQAKELQVWGPELALQGTDNVVSSLCKSVREAMHRYFDQRKTRTAPITHKAREESGIVNPHITGPDETVRCQSCYEYYRRLEALRWGEEGSAPRMMTRKEIGRHLVRKAS